MATCGIFRITHTKKKGEILKAAAFILLFFVIQCYQIYVDKLNIFQFPSVIIEVIYIGFSSFFNIHNN